MSYLVDLLDKNESILSIEKLPFLFTVVQLSSFHREPQGQQSWKRWPVFVSFCLIYSSSLQIILLSSVCHKSLSSRCWGQLCCFMSSNFGLALSVQKVLLTSATITHCAWHNLKSDIHPSFLYWLESLWRDQVESCIRRYLTTFLALEYF